MASYWTLAVLLLISLFLGNGQATYCQYSPRSICVQRGYCGLNYERSLCGFGYSCCPLESIAPEWKEVRMKQIQNRFNTVTVKTDTILK